MRIAVTRVQRRGGWSLLIVTLSIAAAAAAAPVAAAAQSRPRAAAATVAAPPRADADMLPTVVVDYSWLLDDACAMQTGRALDTTLVVGVRAHVPAYNGQWAARGPALLRTAREVVGQPFQFHETIAALVTCGLPSMSFPLVLNARSFWRASADSSAGENTLFVATLFHEVLHRYVHDRLQQLPGATTPLLTKYAAEPPVVRHHLHLFAIQQLVYERRGLGPDLARMTALEGRLRNGAIFTRAHEIVAAEGAEAFVRELQPNGGGGGRPAAASVQP